MAANAQICGYMRAALRLAMLPQFVVLGTAELSVGSAYRLGGCPGVRAITRSTAAIGAVRDAERPELDGHYHRDRACQDDNLTSRRNIAMFLTIGALALPRSHRAAGRVARGRGSPTSSPPRSDRHAGCSPADRAHHRADRGAPPTPRR